MTKAELVRLGEVWSTFNTAERSLDRALLHVPQLIGRMKAAARLGLASPASVERALTATGAANTMLEEARSKFDAAKLVVVGFGDVEPWPCLERSYGDVEPIPCPQKKGSLQQLEVAFGDGTYCPPLKKPSGELVSFGDADQCPPNEWGLTLRRPQEVAFGDHEIPSPEKKGSLTGGSVDLPAAVVAAERGIKREINFAEGMIDRAFLCTTRAIASAAEERRKLRLPPTFGQEVIDHLIAASAILSKAFAELYSVHEVLVDVKEEVAVTVSAPQIQAA